MSSTAMAQVPVPDTRASVPYLVVNPRSANGATGRRWERLEAEARSILGEVACGITQRTLHATELTRAALRAGHRTIIAVGGDGTLNEVVNGFFDEAGEPIAPDAAVALLPRGTGGDFRRTIEMPLRFEEALRRIADAPARPIDLGRVRFRTHAGHEGVRYFVNIASFGISGQVVREVNRTTKAFGGFVSFYLASFKAMLGYRDRQVRISIDGGAPETVPVTTLAVANGRYFGGGMLVAPDAKFDDGAFACTLWGGYGFLDFVFRSKALYSGAHAKWPRTRVFPARTLHAESDEEVLLDVDGEQPGTLPATFEILPGALLLKA